MQMKTPVVTIQEQLGSLTQEMEHIRFWHYCEVCGKKKLLTADEAFEQGWDYPPQMGQFRIISPRTCGNCCMSGTLYVKLLSGEKAFSNLSADEKETLEGVFKQTQDKSRNQQ